MKEFYKIIHLFFLLLIGNWLNAQNIDFTIKYNPSSENFEVYGQPDFNDATFFVGGGSQLTLVLPASVKDTALIITDVNGGLWTDNSQIYSPTADAVHDFHGIASNGSFINWVTGEELLLFTFELPGGGCVDGLRLFENNSDPQDTAPGMGGGDFNNYVVDIFTFIDHYNGNYDNNGIVCNPFPPIMGCHFKTEEPIQLYLTDTYIDFFTKQQFILTDSIGKIQYVVDSLPFTGVISGDYLAFVVEYDTTATLPNLSIGNYISQIGGDCVDISEPLPIGICDCNNDTGDIVFTSSGQDLGQDIKQIYLLTDGKTEILQIDTISNFTGLIDGVYNVYALNRNTTGVINNVQIGQRISAIYGDCFDLSDPLGFVVCNANEPPVIIANPLNILQDSMGAICVPIMDNNPLDTFTVMSCGANHGTENVHLDGKNLCIDYLPEKGYTGFDSVCVIVCDQGDLCDTSMIPITIVPPSIAALNLAPPEIVPNSITTPVDSSTKVCMPLLDPNSSDTLEVVLHTGFPYNGTAIPIIENRQLCIDYTPNPGFKGRDPIRVIVCDQTGLCDTANIPVTVIPSFAPPDSMQPPVVVFPTIVGPENTTLTYCGPIMDNSPLDTHQVMICRQPTNGVATALVDNLSGEVCIELVPDTDFIGEDSMCIIVCDTNNLCDTVEVPILILPSITILQLKVMLQGAMMGTVDGLMRDDLRRQGFLPKNQPYHADLSSRFTHKIGGGETVDTLLFQQNINTPDAIVDWMFIEIRALTDRTILQRSSAALVQRDGDIVSSVDGMPLRLQSLPDSFYVSVKHRNHLGVMTLNPVVSIRDTATFDFTIAKHVDLFTNLNYDTLALTTMSGKRALWAGNANADGKTKYIGSINDQIKINSDVLTQQENTTFSLNFDNAFGYYYGDLNMDGKVKNDGVGNDRIILQNIVLTYPRNFYDQIHNNYNLMLEQLP